MECPRGLTGAGQGRAGGCTAHLRCTGTLPPAPRTTGLAHAIQNCHRYSQRSRKQRERQSKRRTERGRKRESELKLSFSEGKARLACLGVDQVGSGADKVRVMSSHVGAAGVYSSSRVGGHGNGDAGEENTSSEAACMPDALCLEESRWLRNADPTGEGRSAIMEELLRPPLPGRKAHRKTQSEDNRERDRPSVSERNQDGDEESVESVGARQNGRERVRQSHRKTEGSETHGDSTGDRQGRSGTESLSSSNSDFHQNSTMEEGSDNLHRGLQRLRPHSFGYSVSSSTSTNVCPTRRAMRSVSPTPLRTRPSPQRLSPRRAAGELHRCLPHSSRDQDPFWVEVRSRAEMGQSSQSHQTEIHTPSPTSSELGEEEEEEGLEEQEEEGEDDIEEGEARGSNVVEVMTATLTPLMASSATFAERSMSKREKKRIKCLRRRQRRKERWRQSQLQVSNTKT